MLLYKDLRLVLRDLVLLNRHLVSELMHILVDHSTNLTMSFPVGVGGDIELKAVVVVGRIHDVVLATLHLRLLRLHQLTATDLGLLLVYKR